MLKIGINIVILCCGLFSPTYASVGDTAPDTASFTLVKSAGDIDIYERWYPISEDLSAREVKATFTVKAPPHHAAALIQDESTGRKWNKNTDAYKVLAGNGNSWICYIQYDLPWPVNNQDCVLEYNANYLGQSVIIDFKAVEHPDFPKQHRVQRIPDISGRWVFTKTVEGFLVEYYITTRPSSTLPSWLTDPIIRNNLLETLGSFRKILEARNTQ